MVRAREILSPISSSFRFTGLIIFALEPRRQLGSGSLLRPPRARLESPLNREVLSARYRAGGNLRSILRCLRRSVYSRVRACTAFVALSGIILSDNSAQQSYRCVRRDFYCVSLERFPR